MMKKRKKDLDKEKKKKTSSYNEKISDFSFIKQELKLKAYYYLIEEKFHFSFK